MRYLGETSITSIDEMTFREYRLRMKAYRLRRIDEEYKIYFGAWANRIVNSKKRSGKNIQYRYTKLSQIFDLEKEEEKILNDLREDEPAPDGMLSRYLKRRKEAQNGRVNEPYNVPEGL